MTTILSVIGARPQFIKAAPLSRALRELPGVQEILLHTGQHYDDAMSAIFFRQLGLPAPDINLNAGSGSHATQTATMLVGVERVLLEQRPALVLIYGDTNSTIAAALAAAKLGIPIAHVEAGLRSYNRAMPEEINRVLADQLSALLFCPSDVARGNLALEGITQGVHVVGDVMYDEVLHAASASNDTLIEMGLQAGGYLLATIHRAANTDDPARLAAIVAAFNSLGEPLIFPVHPRTQKVIAALGLQLADHVRAIQPVGYFEMIALLRGARKLLTDSGGMQKEAYWLGVPCITLRDESEWVETLQLGWNTLVGADTGKILDAVRNFQPPATRPALYGDGHSAERIAAIIGDYLGVATA